MKNKTVKLVFALFLSVSFVGCTFVFQAGRRSDVRKIKELSQQVDELTQAQRLLEDMLSREIQEKQVKLKMIEKGLVITFVADILFDSGKAQLRSEAEPILDKVAKVLKEKVPDLKVGIEGHTDNQPIKVSGWKSNWELSVQRALSVLHYLADEKGIMPERLSAIGFGEYQRIASNDTAQGRRQNRRVEIVIMPKVTKVKDSVKEPKTVVAEPKENLK